MALTHQNVAGLNDIHTRIRAIASEVEDLYGGPGTRDAAVNQAIIMLHHQLQATKWVSHNAARVSQDHYAPGWTENN